MVAQPPYDANDPSRRRTGRTVDPIFDMAARAERPFGMLRIATRSLHGAKRNAGPSAPGKPYSASLHTGYACCLGERAVGETGDGTKPPRGRQSIWGLRLCARGHLLTKLRLSVLNLNEAHYIGGAHSVQGQPRGNDEVVSASREALFCGHFNRQRFHVHVVVHDFDLDRVNAPYACQVARDPERRGKGEDGNRRAPARRPQRCRT